MMKYIAFCCLFLWGCSEANRSDDQAEKKLLIVCTTGMIGDAVANLVDSTTIVKTLMGPGTDPHLFKPTKNSLDLLANADIIVANGLHLEGRMQDILEKLGKSKPVVFIGELVNPANIIYADEAGLVPDPHIWFDVALWREAISQLQISLEKESVSMSNPEKYLVELLELNDWTKMQMSTIPAEQRVLLTAHDAFEYFGNAYDVEVIGLQGISTVAEYGIRDVTNMVDLIIDQKVKAVFVESSISSRSIEAVIAGANKRDYDVVLGGTLYSDALGAADGDAGTYVKMVKHNVETISKSLR